MSTTNLNIRVDKEIKEHSEKIFNELGMSMSTAINLFLRATIRENGIPFALNLDTPNKKTVAAIEEGRKIARDSSVKGYKNIDERKEVLSK